jgi:plastocyanin
MKKYIVFLPVLFLLFASACSPGAEKVEYTIEMTEFAYSPDMLELKVGQEVTLQLINKGALPHELMAGRNVIMEGAIPSGFEQDLFAGQEPVVVMGTGEESEHSMEHEHGNDAFMLSVPGSEEASLTFTVTEDMVGEWEMGCFLDGGSHHIQGMDGKIIVTP